MYSGAPNTKSIGLLQRAAQPFRMPVLIPIQDRIMRLVEDRQVEGGEIDELGLEGTVLGRESMEPTPRPSRPGRVLQTSV